MKIVTASEVKNKFGQVMEMARSEPVLVQTHGRNSVVILDHVEYERLRRMEEARLGDRTKEATRSGFVGAETTSASLHQRPAESDKSGNK